MSFTNTNFIFLFLPIFLLVYSFVPSKVKAVALLAGSILFYYFATSVNDLAILLALVLVNYLLARLIGVAKEWKRKVVVCLTLILDVGFLVYFKFFNDGILMLGVSFFTFQLCSYVIDVYRNTIEAEKNVLAYSNSILTFTKIASGPLVRYGNIKDELKSLKTTRVGLEDGFELFVIGLILKVIIADTLAGVWENILQIGFESISTPLAWLGAISFSLRLYFDFQGYSMMAIGISHMLGITLPRNFDHPYMSSSISEFWRRWHITLGEWFKDYVYIPLGGNKKGLARTIINLLVVWMLTGIWHGTSYNFIIWGAINFALVAMEKLFLGKFLKGHKIVSHIYVVLAAVLFWVVFAVTDIRELGIYFMRMFPFFGSTGGNIYEMDYVSVLTSYGVIMAVGIFACFPVLENVVKKFSGRFWMIAIEFILFWFAIYTIVQRGTSTFMYYAF